MDNNQSSTNAWAGFFAMLFFTVCCALPAWSMHSFLPWWLCPLWLVPVAFAAVFWSVILFAVIDFIIQVISIFVKFSASAIQSPATRPKGRGDATADKQEPMNPVVLGGLWFTVFCAWRLAWPMRCYLPWWLWLPLFIIIALPGIAFVIILIDRFLRRKLGQLAG